MFADALSRPPATATTSVNCISLKDTAVAQRSDPYLSALRAGKPCPDNLLLKNKAYYHSDGTLYVPVSTRQKVLQACHDNSGHFGPELTVNTLRQTFYWPRLYTRMLLITLLRATYAKLQTQLDLVPVCPSLVRNPKQLRLVIDSI